MRIFGSLIGLFGGIVNAIASINPANGLPMVGAVDIEGNPFGTDAHHDSFDNDVTSCLDHDWITASCDDSWSSSCFDD